MADALVLEASTLKSVKVQVLSVAPNAIMVEWQTRWSKKPMRKRGGSSPSDRTKLI